ncbi:DUF1295 domain protein [Obelidium mucronatum]|nr:DUF1295 domain protein [Obelidium mucronatum]
MAKMSSLWDLIFERGSTAAYTEMHPALSGLWLSLLFGAVTFVAGCVTKNYSHVDRLWSITPVLYSLNYVLAAYHRGLEFNLRLAVMAGLVTVWGLRLTYNFYRKGGYNLNEEDYRWPVLRRIITNPILWHLFSFFFISWYQHVLLYLITVPFKTAYDAIDGGIGFEWQTMDTIATFLFVSFLLLETVADQQQWNFQEQKWRLIKSGKRLEELPAPYNIGFLSTGLFAYSRHPNFFGEISLWWSLYLFSVSADGNWFNAESIVGTVLLSLLFQGSTRFTEWITVSKYPIYRDYQRKVSMLVPWIPLRTPLAAAKKT